MHARQAISLLTLLAFLPLATGCSTQKAVSPETDPVTPDEVTPDEAFLLSDQVRIEGYTTHSDGFRDWAGFVRTATPDSLEFFEKISSANAPPAKGSSFRLSRTDVISLRVLPPDDSGVIGIVVVGIAIFVMLIAAAAAGGGFGPDFDEN